MKNARENVQANKLSSDKNQWSLNVEIGTTREKEKRDTAGLF